MLYEKISEERMRCRSDKSLEVEYNLLTTLYSDLALEQKTSGGKPLTDDDVIRVLNKYKKNNDESLKLIDPADSRHGDYLREQAVILAFLPRQLSADELKKIITGAKEAGAVSMGEIMGLLKKDYNGMFNPKEASALAKEILG